MTPEAQRIAIAEACPSLFVVGESVFGLVQLYWKQDDKYQGAAVDPMNDLNAMHEAEKVILEKRLEFEWAYQMYQVLRGNHEDKDISLLLATAAQRAEAFLKTLGKWT